MNYPPRNLKVYDEPTVFNKEMAIGLFLAGPIGAIIGGFVGKSRMKNELQYGKTVGEPTAWNKDTLLGGLMGNALGGLAVAAVVVSLQLPLAIAAFGGLIGTIGGAYLGAKKGEARMQQEYEYAQKQEHYFAGKAPGKAAEVNLEPQVEQTTYRDLVTQTPEGHLHR